jgi:hypothetical protein
MADGHGKIGDGVDVRRVGDAVFPHVEVSVVEPRP